MDTDQKNEQSLGNTPITQPAVSTVHTPVKESGTSNDTRTIVAVLFLIFVYPVGALLAIFWTKWPKWVKALAFAPMLIITGFLVLATTLVAVNPSAQFKKAEYLKDCEKTKTRAECNKNFLEEQLRQQRVTPFENTTE